MRLTCYLIVSHTGAVRAVRRKPNAVRAGELVLPLRIDIPNSAFAPYLASVEINSAMKTTGEKLKEQEGA